MDQSGIAKNQHYVPQFLLRNFTYRKHQIHVFDKKTDKQFSSHTKNVASENGFYNFSIDRSGTKYTLETSLSKLEARATTIINSVIANKSLNQLADDDRIDLAFFIAVQVVRTKDFRENFKDMSRQFTSVINERFGLEFDTSNMESEEYLKRYTAESLLKIKDDFLPHFLDKVWVLYEAPKGESFLISDNPVSMYNSLPNRFGGSNIGFAVKGIEIYIPISSKLTIALNCRKLLEDLLTEVMKLKAEQTVSNDLDDNLQQKLIHTDLHLTRLMSGSAVAIDKEQVTHLNSLQVMYSNRYIFSSNKDFQLAKDIIEGNEDIKRGGLRGRVN